MSHTYASLTELREYLSIQDTVSDSLDTLLDTFLTASTKRIDEYVGFPFEIQYGIPEDFLNIRDKDVFILSRWPVIGISTIESGVDYQLNASAGIITLDNGFTGDFTLSYSAGQQAPAQVKVACLELSHLTWTRRKTIGLNQMSMGDFQFSIRKVEHEVDDILHTLDDFRDTRIVHRSFINQLF